MRIAFLALLFLSGLFLFPSCQKEVDFANRNNNPNVQGDFRTKIDGQQWVATKVAVASRIGGIINLSGINSEGKVLTITLFDQGVGTYALDDNSTDGAAAFVDSTLPDRNSFTTNQGLNPGDAGGTLTITAIDETNKRVKGTFSFKVFRQTDGLQRTMTEGSFDLSYATSLPPASSTDTMRVKINGTNWVPHTISGISTTTPLPTLAIVGSDASGAKSVGLIMPPTITPGVYTLDFFGLTYIGQYNPDSDPNHSQASVSGTLTILEHNTSTKRIRGNFNFHAETILPPTLSSDLTEGYFSVKYF